MPLTDTAIRNAKPTGRLRKLFDSDGLFLAVTPAGSKLWRVKVYVDGRETIASLGEYVAKPPAGESEEDRQTRVRGGRLTLSEARAERDRVRAIARQGITPAAEKKRAQSLRAAEAANTFRAVAKEWIEKNRARWSATYLRQVEAFIGAAVYPSIGDLPMREVTAAHILEILRRVESRGTGLERPIGKSKRRAKGAPTAALLIRQWCSAIFRYAVATLRADADPAAALRGAIVRAKTKHHRELAPAELAKFAKSLDEFGGDRTTAIAMRLLLLTFVRPGELRAAEWSEFDLDAARWVIPAERMKLREKHIVPLSTQAVALLRELHALSGTQRWLFPNQRRPKDAPMSATTLNRALERMGFNGPNTIDFSAHGFRATASTLLNEGAQFRKDVIERQLAHSERNKSRKSYNFAEYLPERAQMMQTWADLVEAMGTSNKVVPIGQAKKAA